MTENKGMDNSPIKMAQWVGAKAQDGNSRWIMIKRNGQFPNKNGTVGWRLNHDKEEWTIPQ